MELDFWVDPICPWCWVTSRWIVDVVAPERDLSITWQPISLLKKNEPPPDSEYFAAAEWSHGLLRAMEALRQAEGDAAVLPLYREYGRRIHHDQSRGFSAADVLGDLGFDPALGEAASDEGWDAEIEKRMGIGLDLAGTDIGTPIIALDDENGKKVALFGPVITRVPPKEQSLRLWDCFVDLATIPGFWELKRTRTERPEFGERP